MELTPKERAEKALKAAGYAGFGKRLWFRNNHPDDTDRAVFSPDERTVTMSFTDDTEHLGAYLNAKALAEVLRELVYLKDYAKQAYPEEYEERKPLAWEAARKILAELEGQAALVGSRTGRPDYVHISTMAEVLRWHQGFEALLEALRLAETFIKQHPVDVTGTVAEADRDNILNAIRTTLEGVDA